MSESLFRLLDLPFELRLLIYDYLCPEPENEPPRFDTCHALRIVKLPILQTCTVVRSEVIRHYFCSRIIAIFVNSPRNMTFEFLMANTAYDAISRIELNIFFSLDRHDSKGDIIVVTDWQRRVIEAGFDLVYRAANLCFLSLHCSVFRGIVQLPRRRELDQRLEELSVFDLPETIAVELEWSHATETKPRANLATLEFAVAECERKLRARLPKLQSSRMRWLGDGLSYEPRTSPRIQTGSNFGRRLNRSQPR